MQPSKIQTCADMLDHNIPIVSAHWKQVEVAVQHIHSLFPARLPKNGHKGTTNKNKIIAF